MAFTDQEKASLRYYLGRTDGNTLDSLNSWEELQQAIGLVSADGEERIRSYLLLLDALEAKLSALSCINVEQVDGAKLRSPAEVMNALRAEGRRLVSAIARFLGVMVCSTPFGRIGANHAYRG